MINPKILRPSKVGKTKTIVCPECDGNIREGETTCSLCKGEGKIQATVIER
jgi:DnaJ-class molecular chaperone